MSEMRPAAVPRSESGSPQPPARILLVEDDPAMTTVLRGAMRSRGYVLDAVETAEAALERASLQRPDVVVLDLGLPDLDGIEVCRRLRRWFPNPIVVLTADGDELRKVEALDSGADDYVTKPFSTEELFARLRVALRHRRTAEVVADDAVIRIGDLVVDLGARTATAGGHELDLRPKQYDLLSLLVRNAGKLLTYRALVVGLWGEPRGDRHEALRWHVMGLRKALGSGPDRPTLVNESGVGYRLNEPG
jgi:two-component system KDP operon response regulator KdpE